MSKKNIEMNFKFNEMDEVNKMKVLNIDNGIFTTHRFKGVDKNVVLSDLWNGKTNSEKRKLINR